MAPLRDPTFMLPLQVDPLRLYEAYETVQSELFAGRAPNGCWPGEPASSPLATATAVSALLLVHGGDHSSQHGIPAVKEDPISNSLLFQSDLSELLVESLHWLAQQQNADGGWGDADRSPSNLATTLLVRAAFQLTGVPAKYAELVGRADKYIADLGGFAGLRRMNGKDKSLVAPVLATCAVAELLPWRNVPALPFELACLPEAWQRRMRLPVTSSAIPLLIAIGQARFAHGKPANPIVRALRRAAWDKSTALLQQMQSDDGSYCDSIVWTSFIAIGLASTGRAEHRVARRAVEFLLGALRSNGSWPVQLGFPIRNTALAVDALAGDDDLGASREDDSIHGCSPNANHISMTASNGNGSGATNGIKKGAVNSMESATIQWLLTCQQQRRDTISGADSGGWAWTDRPSGVPNAFDTALVLSALARNGQNEKPPARIQVAVDRGIDWLLALQNKDGGWPTFSHGWTWLVSDQSAADVTAQVLRALAKWRGISRQDARNSSTPQDQKLREERLVGAIGRGMAYLESKQHADGYWLPLWAGNYLHSCGENRVWGTSQVLILCAELGELEGPMARRAANWLAGAQHQCGGWGPLRTEPLPRRTATRDKAAALNREPCRTCSVEETSLAIAALLPLVKDDERCQRAAELGLAWLIEAIAAGRHHEPAPIHACLGKLWYSEWLYPQIFATATLGRATRLVPRPDRAKWLVAGGSSK